MRPHRLCPALLSVLLAAAATAQTAFYAPFGRGCNGQPVGISLRQNDQNVRMPTTTTPATYAYPATNTTGAAIQVVGLELLAVNHYWATERVVVMLFEDASGPGARVHTQPAATHLATGSVQVSWIPAWRATGTSPGFVVPAGGVFWIGHEAYRSNSSSENLNGTLGTVPTFLRVANGPWTSPGPTRPAFRVLATSAAYAVPALAGLGWPRRGQSFTVRIERGTPLAPAALFFGSDPTSWRGAPLPLDLAAVGAPDCLLYAGLDRVMPLMLDAAGAASVPILVPNDPALLGLYFYNQAMIAAPGQNALQVVFTNFGLGIVGP